MKLQITRIDYQDSLSHEDGHGSLTTVVTTARPSTIVRTEWEFDGDPTTLTAKQLHFSSTRYPSGDRHRGTEFTYLLQRWDGNQWQVVNVIYPYTPPRVCEDDDYLDDDIDQYEGD